MGSAASGGIRAGDVLAPGVSAIDRATGGQLDEALGGVLTDPIKGLSNLGSRAGASFGINGLARPQLATLQQGTSVQDVQNAQANAQNSLSSQQRLLEALQAQNGLGLQNQAAGMQQGYADQLAGAGGVGAQQQAIQGLQNAAGMYGNIASGQGPNPAMAAFNQATGQNVANQAALMAGQRGAGSNVGLMARQAAQQGAATQQQGVGQMAQLQAQQQLNALQGYAGAQQALGGLGAGLSGQQLAANNALAGQANQMAGQQIGTANQAAQNQLANQQQMQQALGQFNQANVANQGSVNAANAGIAQGQMAGQQKIVGGILQGGAAAAGLAHGGQVHHMADGGMTGPTSSFGRYLTGMANGGLAHSGGHVEANKPSQKAEKSGDSLKNDKIPTMLSEGEIVIPRSIVMGKNPEIAAARFVKETLMKRKK